MENINKIDELIIGLFDCIQKNSKHPENDLKSFREELVELEAVWAVTPKIAEEKLQRIIDNLINNYCPHTMSPDDFIKKIRLLGKEIKSLGVETLNKEMVEEKGSSVVNIDGKVKLALDYVSQPAYIKKGNNTYMSRSEEKKASENEELFTAQQVTDEIPVPQTAAEILKWSTDNLVHDYNKMSQDDFLKELKAIGDRYIDKVKVEDKEIPISDDIVAKEVTAPVGKATECEEKLQHRLNDLVNKSRPINMSQNDFLKEMQSLGFKLYSNKVNTEDESPSVVNKVEDKEIPISDKKVVKKVTVPGEKPKYSYENTAFTPFSCVKKGQQTYMAGSEENKELPITDRSPLTIATAKLRIAEALEYAIAQYEHDKLAAESKIKIARIALAKLEDDVAKNDLWQLKTNDFLGILGLVNEGQTKEEKLRKEFEAAFDERKY
jgi:hypothetical protein